MAFPSVFLQNLITCRIKQTDRLFPFHSILSEQITPDYNVPALDMQRTPAHKKSGAEAAPPFIMMFLRSFVICMIAGYILIFIFMPLLLKQLLKKEGISER